MPLRILTFFFILCFCLGCSDTPDNASKPGQQKETTVQWTPPPAGTTIDELKQRITEDRLNELYFKVSIQSTPKSKEGVYNLTLAYGYNEHETEITLPRWPNTKFLKPMLKPEEEKYHCLVGFYANDKVFHELYEVKVNNGAINLKQTRAYYLK